MGYILEKKRGALLFLSFFIVSTLVIVLMNYYNYLLIENKLSQGFYSDNAIFFTSDFTSNSKIIEKLKKERDDFIIFKEFGLNYDIRGVYYKGKIDQPFLKEGRFFNTTDFDKQKRVAVVGQNIFEKNDSKKFIKLFGENYEIIGILGFERPSQYDRMIFLNLDSVESSEAGLWSIDGKSDIDTMTNYRILEDLIIKNDGNIELVELDTQGIVDILKYEFFNLGTLIVILLLFLISSLYVSQIWFDNKRQEFAIVKLVGYKSSRTVVFEMIKEYTVLAFGGYLSSILLIMFMNGMGISQITINISMIMSGLLLLIFSSCVVINPVFKFYKLKVGELLVGEA